MMEVMNKMKSPHPEAGTLSEARLYLLGTPHADRHVRGNTDPPGPAIRVCTVPLQTGESEP